MGVVKISSKSVGEGLLLKLTYTVNGKGGMKPESELLEWSLGLFEVFGYEICLFWEFLPVEGGESNAE